MDKTGGKRCVKGYQWPASALTSHEMALLESWREKTGVPITQLLRQCVLRIKKEIKPVIKSVQNGEAGYKAE